MSKHTQGKWIHHGGWGECVVKEEREGGAANIIATCRNPGIPHEEARANARLIAAAPDLLAACKGAQNWIREYHTQLGEPWDDGMFSLEQELIAAIKKAQGEA